MLKRRSYPDGTHPVIDIQSEGPEWLEFCGALYESYAADQEAGRYDRLSPRPSLSANQYARTAHQLAEDVEYAVYEKAQQLAEEW